MPLGSYLTGPTGAPTIVLDAGHGGTDLGARARHPYCEEKRICLQTARLVKKYLTQLGYNVIMTRDTDVFLALPKRVEIASQKRADLFVSIHFNSARNPTAHGIEIFYPEIKDNRVRTQSSKKLAEAILGRVLRRTSALSRGVKKGNLHVIRETEMPAVLIEGGFISNPTELHLLKSREYQEKIARGIADGVSFFLKRK